MGLLDFLPFDGEHESIFFFFLQDREYSKYLVFKRMVFGCL